MRRHWSEDRATEVIMYNEGVFIVKEMRDYAAKYAQECIEEIEQCVARGEYIPDGFKDQNRHCEGCIGESILYRIFKDRDIQFVWTLPSRPRGISDGGIDFYVPHTEGITIDVKKIPEGGKLFIVNVRELERAGRISDYFVGINEVRNWGYFECWFTREEVLRLKTTDEYPYLKKKFKQPAYVAFINEIGMYNRSLAEFLQTLPGKRLNCDSGGVVEPPDLNQPR